MKMQTDKSKIKKEFKKRLYHFVLQKQIVGGVSRRRWKRALESPPTGIDIQKVSP